MEMSSIRLGDTNKLGCYLRDIEHFSESKMAVATILDIWKFPIVDPDDLHGRVIPLFWMVEGGESIFGVILWILGQCQGQTGGQMSNLAAK